jgi:hypothetical protein
MFYSAGIDIVLVYEQVSVSFSTLIVVPQPVPTIHVLKIRRSTHEIIDKHIYYVEVISTLA